MNTLDLTPLTEEEQLVIEGGILPIVLAAISAAYVVGEVAHAAGAAVGRSLR